MLKIVMRGKIYGGNITFFSIELGHWKVGGMTLKFI